MLAIMLEATLSVGPNPPRRSSSQHRSHLGPVWPILGWEAQKLPVTCPGSHRGRADTAREQGVQVLSSCPLRIVFQQLPLLCSLSFPHSQDLMLKNIKCLPLTPSPYHELPSLHSPTYLVTVHTPWPTSTPYPLLSVPQPGFHPLCHQMALNVTILVAKSNRGIRAQQYHFSATSFLSNVLPESCVWTPAGGAPLPPLVTSPILLPEINMRDESHIPISILISPGLWTGISNCRLETS